ncbi:hypothetical protein SLEP1_g39181 [Rubroshorea leprosula]|uniref:Dirigent protein n=1 Tax=Rubroshorea leprosula TaxID=152421 RepID=A0AAV5KZS6_9ROSI|nr:hypothetical protein SLEP1_g39181 [Rubroshorea leprosula]
MGRTILPVLVAFPFIVSSIVSSFAIIEATQKGHDFVTRLDPKSIGLGKEKLSHFCLYWHDVVSGRKPTSVRVVQPSNITATGFGIISMIDDPLTDGQEMSSKMVGRAQGFYALASHEEIGLLMSMNFAFTEGKYNGNTITVLGGTRCFRKCGDAGDRWQWAVPVCKGLCSGQDSYI